MVSSPYWQHNQLLLFFSSVLCIYCIFYEYTLQVIIFVTLYNSLYDCNMYLIYIKCGQVIVIRVNTNLLRSQHAYNKLGSIVTDKPPFLSNK